MHKTILSFPINWPHIMILIRFVCIVDYSLLFFESKASEVFKASFKAVQI